MSSLNGVADDAKNEFWAVVEDCLREFHRVKQPDARRKAAKLRNAIERMTNSEVELFYHSEPFDVACDIADRPLDLSDYHGRYLRIRDEKHGNAKELTRNRPK